MASDLMERLQFAKSIAIEAGRHTLKYFQQSNFQVERKSDDSPVTIADREAEQLLRKQIAESFPDDAILGEEFGETAGESGYRWILDPIDGTKSFISGVPLYGTLVGVEKDRAPLIGVIYIPGLDECIWAGKGEGAWYTNGDAPPIAAKVASRENLSDCVFVTSEYDGFLQRGAVQVFERLQEATYITRMWGDCYGYLLVATGRVDVMLDPLMNVWDAAALLPILEEAGGKYTDWQGEPTIYGEEGIAANSALIEKVVAITRTVPRQAQTNT